MATSKCTQKLPQPLCKHSQPPPVTATTEPTTTTVDHRCQLSPPQKIHNHRWSSPLQPPITTAQQCRQPPRLNNLKPPILAQFLNHHQKPQFHTPIPKIQTANSKFQNPNSKFELKSMGLEALTFNLGRRSRTHPGIVCYGCGGTKAPKNFARIQNRRSLFWNQWLHFTHWKRNKFISCPLFFNHSKDRVDKIVFTPE